MVTARQVLSSALFVIAAINSLVLAIPLLPSSPTAPCQTYPIPGNGAKQTEYPPCPPTHPGCQPKLWNQVFSMQYNQNDHLFYFTTHVAAPANLIGFQVLLTNGVSVMVKPKVDQGCKYVGDATKWNVPLAKVVMFVSEW